MLVIILIIFLCLSCFHKIADDDDNDDSSDSSQDDDASSNPDNDDDESDDDFTNCHDYYSCGCNDYDDGCVKYGFDPCYDMGCDTYESSMVGVYSCSSPNQFVENAKAFLISKGIEPCGELAVRACGYDPEQLYTACAPSYGCIRAWDICEYFD